ncbi:MAG: DUF4185 domain-containing protein [Candidatus Omnitrophica bacterium]|nr:DUF4185 domain-containing protein [Candidatus Omnitrophota bacterium]
MTSRPLKVESSRDLGPQFTDNPHRMVGQDGAYSIPLSPQESFWFFGDTLFGERTPGESLWYPGGERIGPEDMGGKHGIDRMVTNCGLILKDKTGRDGLTDFHYLLNENGEVRQILPRLEDEDPDEIRIWCLHGIKIEGKLYFYWIKVTMLAEGPMPVNFAVNGSGLAIASEEDWKFERVRHQGESILWGEEDPKFGTAVLLHEGMVYVYGVKHDARGVQCAHVARVPKDRLHDFEAYEYLATEEPKWSRHVQDASPVLTGPPNEMSVSFNSYLGCFLAVHSNDLSGDIVGRTAPNPWGPWSDPVVLWTVRPEYQNPPPYPPLIYAGKEHPEIAGEGGKVLYLTYIEFEEYFPHLVEVTLA